MVQSTIDLLAKLVSFDTTSRNSNLELIAFIEDYLDGHGISHHRIYDETGTKANLFATIGPEDRAGYILSGHTDVVPVDGQDWTSDPFTLIERGGQLYGRGSTDMKGFVAAVLAQAPEMTRRPLTRPIHFAFSYDEEVGCIGVRRLIKELCEKDIKPEACFVGEPTNMQVVLGHKAKRSFDVAVRGRASHSSLAPRGVNAVEYAALLIAHIRGIGKRLAEGPKDDLFDVPFTTAQSNMISGGTAGNIVPDLCRFTFEFRAIGQDDPEALAQEVKNFARDVLEPEMRAISPDTGITISPKTGYPGLDTSADSAVATLAKGLADRNDHAKVSYGAEAGLFDEMAGIATVVCGPGSIRQAHEPDEFIAISELEKCGHFLNRLIDHACEGGP